ncbi:BRO family protein [Glaesserella parasuis]|nr:BRO family protein [Glaesserella parasuis]MDP0272203.1 BRO family protein [Glaesserella parasuis]MDP0306310.1 BRO family protein [Glaesserella parasuis]MDP0471014.1 BRO family protein [Glaesserella parasuis]
MSNQISTFNFKSNPVRIEVINNEPHFCLTDVCIALDISNANSSRFRFNEKGLHKMYTLTKGGKQEVTFINEPNLYRIIFRSNKSQAIDFQNWVFEEVLPQIRKTGQYSQNSAQIVPLTITPEQQRAIQEAVQQAHYRTGLHWQEIYSRLKSTFNVAKYDQLPQTMFEHVINFLNTLGNQYRPIDRSKKDITIAGLDAEQIAKYLVRARAFAKEVEVFHRKLYEDLGIPRYVKNDIAGKAYDIAHEFNVWLDPFIEQALPQLNQQRLARF